MLSVVNISIISLAYLLILFGIAYFGDKFIDKKNHRFKPIIVALCLPIFFTAWSFYGTSAQAANNGWFIPPTTIGAILSITFAIPVIKRLITLGKQRRSTSIVGFISAQYQNSKTVSLLITTVVIIGTLPYLSLQLEAISTSFDVISSPFLDGFPLNNAQKNGLFSWQDTTAIVTILMAVFSIVFGTRHVDLTEHHNGLMLAVAFESLVKLISVCGIGLFVAYQLFNNPSDVLIQALNNENIQQALSAKQSNGYFTAVILGMAAIVCLPWLFHLLVVESNDQTDADTAQWFFPSYAIIFSFFLLLVIVVGMIYFQAKFVNTEMFFLAIPLAEKQSSLALLAYLGGLSAATSMVIVATITLSTMICNDMIMPVLLRHKRFHLQTTGVGSSLLKIRRCTIVVILLMAYIFYRLVGASGNLGAMGLISITLLVQLFPILIGALYWPKRHKYGVIAGVLTGAIIWAYTLLTPTLVEAGWFSHDLLQNGLFGLSQLRPEALFNFTTLDPLTHGVLWSLGLNTFVFIVVSFYFQKHSLPDNEQTNIDGLSNASLLHLISRFLGEEQAKLALLQHCNQHGSGFCLSHMAHVETVTFAESLLAGIIGPSSAKHIITLAPRHIPDETNTTERLLQEASNVLKFSRELLQSSIDNMSQGITVIDNNQRLVAWNKRCIELFEYPENLFYVGNPIAELVRFNAQQEKLSEQQVAERINEQLEKYTSQQSYVYKRISVTQQVIEVRVEPIPSKGHVITYTDITSYQLMVDALKESNETLEQRVSQRTTQLTNINHRLGVAKSQAEAANQSKIRFLAAASHDLAQPLNAARLFVTALQHIDLPKDPSSLINNLSDSLQNAESLISELFDIAKIDAGVVKTTISHFPVKQVFDLLQNDFGVLARKKNIDFHVKASDLIVQTDSKLLLRILQNLLANALRYTHKGKVIIGCRRTKNSVKIEVWDTGIGILEKDAKDIFTEFKRIGHSGNDEGSGLGLATVHRLCLLLNLPIEVNSIFGKGSGFKITVPRGSTAKIEKPLLDVNSKSNKKLSYSSLNILAIDNEEKILKGMHSLLGKWHHNVITATSLAEAKASTSASNAPDVILADYHLENEYSGIEVVQTLFKYWGKTVPCIVISADQTEQVKAESKGLGFLFMQKPIKPLALRAALSRISSK